MEDNDDEGEDDLDGLVGESPRGSSVDITASIGSLNDGLGVGLGSINDAGVGEIDKTMNDTDDVDDLAGALDKAL